MVGFGSETAGQDDDFQSFLLEGDNDAWTLDEWNWDPFNLVAAPKPDATTQEPQPKRARAEPQASTAFQEHGARPSALDPLLNVRMYLPTTTQCRPSALDTGTFTTSLPIASAAAPMLFESQLQPSPKRAAGSALRSYSVPTPLPQVEPWQPRALERRHPSLLGREVVESYQALLDSTRASYTPTTQSVFSGQGLSQSALQPRGLRSYSRGQQPGSSLTTNTGIPQAAAPPAQLNSTQLLHSTPHIDTTPLLDSMANSMAILSSLNNTPVVPSRNPWQNIPAATAQQQAASCCAGKAQPVLDLSALAASAACGPAAHSCCVPTTAANGTAAPNTGSCCLVNGEPSSQGGGGCCHSRTGLCNCWADPANGCGCTCCYREDAALSAQPETSVQSYNQQGHARKRSIGDYALSNPSALSPSSFISGMHTRHPAPAAYSIQAGHALKLPYEASSPNQPLPDAALARAIQLATADPRTGEYWAHNSPESISQVMNVEPDGGDIPVLLPVGMGDQSDLVCLVQGCSRSLANLKDYHLRYRICAEHIKLPHIMREGRLQRFCQQCGRFHLLSSFDGERRSCRDQLNKHNMRRRMRRAAAAGNLEGVTTTEVNTPAGGSGDEGQVCSMEEANMDDKKAALEAPAPAAPLSHPLVTHQAAAAGPPALKAEATAQSPFAAASGMTRPAQAQRVTASADTNAAGSAGAVDGGRLLQTLLENPSQLQALRSILGMPRGPLPFVKQEQAAHPPQQMPPTAHGSQTRSLSAPASHGTPVTASHSARNGQGRNKPHSPECYVISDGSGSVKEENVQSGMNCGPVESPEERAASGEVEAAAATSAYNAEHAPAAAASPCDPPRTDCEAAAPAQDPGPSAAASAPAYDPDLLSARLSLKIFKKTPEDMPPDLKRQFSAWMALAPTAIECHLRPGCVHLTVQLLLAPAAYDSLLDHGLGPLVEHLVASRHPCWCTGVVLLQLFDEVALLVEGEVCRVPIAQAPKGISWQAPVLESVWPLCTVGETAEGVGGVVMLRGNELAGRPCRAVCRTSCTTIVTANLNAGCKCGGTGDRNDAGGGMLVQLAPLPGCWLAFVELEVPGGLLSEEHPLLVVDDPELAQEVNRLATSDMDPYSVSCLLVDLGMVLQAGSQQLPCPLPTSELAAKAQRLLVLACQYSWPTVAQRLLPLAMLGDSRPEAAAEAVKALEAAGILFQLPPAAEPAPVRQGCGCGCTCPLSPMRC